MICKPSYITCVKIINMTNNFVVSKHSIWQSYIGKCEAANTVDTYVLSIFNTTEIQTQFCVHFLYVMHVTCSSHFKFLDLRILTP
jgi:hypothetical protein